MNGLTIGDRVFVLGMGTGKVVGFHLEHGADVELDSGVYREQIPFARVVVSAKPATAEELEAAGQKVLFGEDR